MPWKTECVREQRWQMVRLWLAGKVSGTALCRRFRISRKTAHKWRKRFEAEGRRGLADRSHCALVVSNRPTLIWLRRVRRLRVRFGWGARKLRLILQEEHGRRGVPSVAAITRWLRRWELSRRPGRRRRQGPILPRPHLTKARWCNHVWSVDFKGWFCTADRTKVNPLTVQDRISCYLIAVVLLRTQSLAETRQAFLALFRQWGLPRVIRVDNGSPFGAEGALGLTRLSVWWMRLGIRVEFLTPGCPGENASHEQMHSIYKNEVATPPAPTLRAQKLRTERWRQLYNEVRPHEGLGMRRPARLYRPSRRQLPQQLLPLTYPAPWLSRRVRSKGMINLNGVLRFIGEAFEGERVGLKRCILGWEVYFGQALIGRLEAAGTNGLHATRYRGKRKVNLTPLPT